MKGGKRDGAGRKAGTKNKSTLEIKELLDSHIDFEIVVTRLFELVNGVTMQETRANGDEVVYTRAPDSNAAKILLEFRFGKAKQQMDVTSDGKQITLPSWINEDKP